MKNVYSQPKPRADEICSLQNQDLITNERHDSVHCTYVGLTLSSARRRAQLHLMNLQVWGERGRMCPRLIHIHRKYDQYDFTHTHALLARLFLSSKVREIASHCTALGETSLDAVLCAYSPARWELIVPKECCFPI